MLEEFKKQLAEAGQIYLRVKARPNAGKTAVKEIKDGEIKINIGAQAEKGKANAELIKFLSKEFEVSRSDISIISGAGDRIKLIRIINHD